MIWNLLERMRITVGSYRSVIHRNEFLVEVMFSHEVSIFIAYLVSELWVCPVVVYTLSRTLST